MDISKDSRLVHTVRGLQCLCAIIVLISTAYSLSITGADAIKPALIPALLIALLTIALVLPLTTSFLPVQRKFYRPLHALALDCFTTCFWLICMTAIAANEDVAGRYVFANGATSMGHEMEECGGCKAALRSGAAAAVFSGFEAVLFLMASLAGAHEMYRKLSSEVPRDPVDGQQEGMTEQQKVMVPPPEYYGIPARYLPAHYHIPAPPGFRNVDGEIRPTKMEVTTIEEDASRTSAEQDDVVPTRKSASHT